MAQLKKVPVNFSNLILNNIIVARILLACRILVCHCALPHFRSSCKLLKITKCKINVTNLTQCNYLDTGYSIIFAACSTKNSCFWIPLPPTPDPHRKYFSIEKMFLYCSVDQYNNVQKRERLPGWQERTKYYVCMSIN